MSFPPIGNAPLDLASGLARADSAIETVSARISSARRIDRPAVDGAGVGQVARIEAGQARLRAVDVNIQNGVSRLQAADGQLSTLGRIVTRLSELATLGADATRPAADRAQYAVEFTQLQTQLRQIVGGTRAEIGGVSDVERPLGRFNDRELFGPGPGDVIAVGVEAGETVALPVTNLRQGALGALLRQDSAGDFTLSPSSPGSSAALGETLVAALSQLGEARASTGAAQGRLVFAAGVAEVAGANREAALGAIQDADIAAETTRLASLRIRSEAHTAMLVQARDVTARLLPLLARD